jgi:DNA-binding beta-propeller fold protein YncE
MNHFRRILLVASICLLPVPSSEARAGQLFKSAAVVDTGLQPTSIVVDQSSGSLIVTNFGGDQVQRFPVDDECQIGPPGAWATGRGPLDIAFDGSNRLIFITYFTDNQLGVFALDGADLKEVGRYPTGRGPVAVSISPSGNQVFVSNVFDGTVTVFDKINGEGFLPRVAVATVSNPRSMAIDAEGQFLFVADETDPVIATLEIEADGSLRSASRYVMQGPAEDLLAPPSGNLLYVTQGEDNHILTLGVGSLGQLRQSASTSFEGVEERHDELGNLGLTAPFPGSLSFDEKLHRLFVTGRQTSDVYAYDVENRESFEPLGSYPVYEYPEDVAMDSSSSCLYVISSAYGQILGMKVLP